MILAATNDGIRDVETGAVTLAGRDVTHLVCTGDTSWALVDGGRRVLHAHTWGDWEEIARVDGAPGHCLNPLSKGGLLVVPRLRTRCAWRTGGSGASPLSTPCLAATGGRTRRR